MCESLKEITIPDDLSYADFSILGDCYNLERIIVSKRFCNRNPDFYDLYKDICIIKDDLALDRLVEKGKSFKEINDLFMKVER